MQHFKQYLPAEVVTVFSERGGVHGKLGTGILEWKSEREKNSVQVLKINFVSTFYESSGN